MLKNEPYGAELLRIFQKICEEVRDIHEEAREIYRRKNWIPWEVALASGQEAFQHTILRCICSAVAKWLSRYSVVLNHGTTIQTPPSISRNGWATYLDLTLLLGAVASEGGLHPILIRSDKGPILGVILGCNVHEPKDAQDLLELKNKKRLFLLSPEPLLRQGSNDPDDFQLYDLASCSFDPNLSYFVLDLSWTVEQWLNHLLERSVFRVLAPDKHLSGTGFFIGEDGGALTCDHVLFLDRDRRRPIWDKDEYIDILFQDRPLRARLERRWEHEDIAMLSVDINQQEFPGFEPLPLNSYYEPGDEVLCYGFKENTPYTRGVPNYGNIRTDRPRTKVLFEDDVVQEVIIIEGDFGPGLSGSPLVSLVTGGVIGIQTGRHWDRVYDYARKDYIQSPHSFAIPIDKVEGFFHDDRPRFIPPSGEVSPDGQPEEARGH